MNKTQSLLIQLAITAVSTAYGFYKLAGGPEVVPTHWNASGHVDGYGSRLTMELLMPSMLLFFLVLTWLLPALSPKNFEVDKVPEVFHIVMATTSVMMGAIHVTLIEATIGHQFDIMRVMMGIMFLVFAVLGNFLGRIRQNFYMGIRTPWTLANEEVWRITHRIAGRWWFVGGLIGTVAAMVGVPGMILFTAFMILSLSTLPLSYVVSKRVEAR